MANSLINGSFEEPVLTGSAGWQLFPDASQQQANSVPGWLTTATDHKIEIWKSGFNGVPSDEGQQHAELNANQVSTLYQDVPTTPSMKLYWRLAHRGRAGQDTMALDIGAPGATVEQRRMTDGNTAWGHYEGTYTVPADQTTTRFAFRSISAAGGNQGIGNFLDSIFFGAPDVMISHVQNKGAVKRTQSDEYVEITNRGSWSADISDWRLDADDAGQNFAFPAGTVLGPGQSIRVYTNEVHPESGGFSYGSGRAIWNDRGDMARLLDPLDNVMSQLGYGDRTTPS